MIRAAPAAAVMSIAGDVPSEGSEGEEVFIDDDDIINEIPLDEEDLPDQDDDDEQDEDMMYEVEDHSAYAFHGHTDEVFAAACSPVDASLVVSGGKDDRGFLWRIGSAEDVQELPGHNDTVSTVAFSSDGKLVACGSMDGQINVWNTATRTLQGTLEGSESGFEWLKWHLRSHSIIAGSEDFNIWMWDADLSSFVNTFVGHSNTVTCGDFTPDGELICTGSDDATLRIWDPISAHCRHVVRGHGYHTQGLTCLAITWDSQSIVSGSQDSSVHIVSIKSGQVVGSLVGHTNSVECIGVSPRYNWVATGSIDQTLIIWDLTHQAIRSICEHDDGVTCLAWIGSSRYVASGCIDGTVRIWDSLSGELACILSGHRDAVQSLAVSADCNSIVSVSSDKSARVFDISMFK